MNETSSALDLTRAFAEALHRAGAPVHVLEHAVDALMDDLDVPGSIIASPTAIWIEVDGQHRLIRARPEGPCLGRIADLLSWQEQRTSSGSMELPEAPTKQRTRWDALALVSTSSAVGGLVGTTWMDVFASGVGALVLFVGLQRLANHPLHTGVLAFLIALLAGLSTVAGTDPVMVSLSAVVWLLPGLSLTTAMAELGNGHWSSAAARLLGVAFATAELAAGLGAGLWMTRDITPWVAAASLPARMDIIFTVVASFGIAALLRVAPVNRPAGVVVATGAFFASTIVPTLPGTFLTSMAVGITAILYGRWRRTSPLVVSVPGVLLLVPGGVGVRAIQATLGEAWMAGLPLAIQAIATAMAIAGGLAAANGVLAPARTESPNGDASRVGVSKARA